MDLLQDAIHRRWGALLQMPAALCNISAGCEHCPDGACCLAMLHTQAWEAWDGLLKVPLPPARQPDQLCWCHGGSCYVEHNRPFVDLPNPDWSRESAVAVIHSMPMGAESLLVGAEHVSC